MSENVFFDFAIFDNILFALTTVVGVGGVIGLLSRSFSVAIYSAYLFFVRIATETGNDTYMTLLYTVLVTVLVIMGLRIWSFSTGGSST